MIRRLVRHNILVDDDGNTYIYNGESGWGETKDLVKLDSDGALQWQKPFSAGIICPLWRTLGFDVNHQPILASNTTRAEDGPEVSLWLINSATGEASFSGARATTVNTQWQEWEFSAVDLSPLPATTSSQSN